jgi:hypothetical protein
MSQQVLSSNSSEQSISCESDYFKNIRDFNEDEDKSLEKSIHARASEIEVQI